MARRRCSQHRRKCRSLWGFLLEPERQCVQAERTLRTRCPFANVKVVMTIGRKPTTPNRCAVPRALDHSSGWNYQLGARCDQEILVTPRGHDGGPGDRVHSAHDGAPSELFAWAGGSSARRVRTAGTRIACHEADAPPWDQIHTTAWLRCCDFGWRSASSAAIKRARARSNFKPLRQSNWLRLTS